MLIPKHITKGCTKLEYSLLLQGRYYTALHVRSLRGIAILDERSPDSHKEAELIRWTKRLGEITNNADNINEHITNTDKCDYNWQSLRAWIDNDVLYDDDGDEQRYKWLNSLTIHDVQRKFPPGDIGTWFTRDDYLNRFRFQEVEYWKFKDGTVLRYDEGLSYANYLKLTDKL